MILEPRPREASARRTAGGARLSVLMRRGIIEGRMRPVAALVLSLLLVAPLVPAQPSSRDYAEEVRKGSDVHMYLSYSGGAGATFGGEEQLEDSRESVQETREVSVSWEAPVWLRNSRDGTLQGSILTNWTASGMRSVTSERSHEGGAGGEGWWRQNDRTTCASGTVSRSMVQTIRAVPEASGLRLTFEGYPVMNVEIAGACTWTRTSVDAWESKDDSGVEPFGMPVALHHGGDVESEAPLSILVPYDARTSKTLSYRDAIPHGETPAGAYCGTAGIRDEWLAGTCSASGTLTVRTLVDPCPFLRNAYPAHYAELASIPPPAPGSDEAAVRAWTATSGEIVRQVLSDQRSWQLFGCVGDLAPDPWDAMGRVLQMHRDALLQLLREGKLSREGIGELLGAERAMQLLGVGNDAGPTVAEIMAAHPPEPSGTLEVKVHSPVSLHAWDEKGGHVGWDDAADQSVSTIPGAAYEGAPGGPQTLRLPAGLYKITVDELARGHYLLEVAMNDTGAEGEDAAMVAATPGRRTSTHYAVTVGWDGPRLDTFPVRRGAAEGDVQFVDVGKPSVSGRAGGASPSSPGSTGAEGTPVGHETPATPVGAIVVALGLLAIVARRR